MWVSECVSEWIVGLNACTLPVLCVICTDMRTWYMYLCRGFSRSFSQD
jgi:hypothetical protein